jgi:hypothetical protein
LNWRVTDLAGAELGAGKQSATVGARTSSRVGEISLRDPLQKQSAANLLVWLSFDGGGKLASDNLIMLAKPKELKLLDPGLTSAVSGSGADFTVTVRAQHPALWAWLDVPGMDARFSDNFVHIAPDAPVEFKVKLAREMSKQDLANVLQLRSLFDLSSQN